MQAPRIRLEPEVAEINATPYSEEWYEALRQRLGEGVCRRLGFFPIPADLLLSVVIPVYNERDSLLKLLERVREVKTQTPWEALRALLARLWPGPRG